MRIGRWLYHHAPHIEQSPIFQVKKAAVRVTAWLPDGLTPAIQILVGDNPSDPAAYWVNMRMNGQEVRLGNDDATQVVIANSGWYRVDPTDLSSFGPVLIWAEDEEGTLDDKIIPVHVVRTGCGGGAGPTPPPIATQYVRCATLQTLINSGSLVPSAWYGIVDAQPNITAGQIVFVQAVDTDRVSGHAQFWAPWLADGKLWPAKIEPGTTCRLAELHDTDRDVLVRGYQSILVFGAAWNPTYRVRDVTIIDGFVTLDTLSVLERAHIVGSYINFFRSEVVEMEAYGGDVYFNTSTATGVTFEYPRYVRLVGTTIDDLYVGRNSYCELQYLTSVTAANHSPRDTRNIRVEDNSSLFLAKGTNTDVFAANNITVREQSSMQAHFVNGPLGDGFLGRLTVEGGSACYFRDFQYIKNCSFKGGYHFVSGTGAIPANAQSFTIEGCNFEQDYLYIYTLVAPLSLLRVKSRGGYVYTRRGNFSLRQIEVQDASFVAPDTGLFGPNVRFERIRISNFGQIYIYLTGDMHDVLVTQMEITEGGRLQLRGNLQNLRLSNSRVSTDGLMFLSQFSGASNRTIENCAVVDGGSYGLRDVVGYLWHEAIYVAGRGSFSVSVADPNASSSAVSFRIYGGNVTLNSRCITDAGDVYITHFCNVTYNTFGNNIARFRYHKLLGVGSWTFNIDTLLSNIFVYGHFAAGVQNAPYNNTFTTNDIRPEIRNF